MKNIANDKQIRAFDLFCGGGGSSRGANMAGVTPVAGLDKWKLAADTYKLNFPEATVYCSEAGLLSPQRVLEEVGDIDLLLSSPECTSHSIAKGNKPRSEKSRETAFEVLRFVEVLQPRWIVIENVLQMKRWSRFNEWHDTLKLIGYRTECGILDAQYFGTPQSRRRLFIVGDLEGEPSLPVSVRRTKKMVQDIIGLGESKKEPWAFTPLYNPKRAKATLERAERAIDALGENVPFLIVYYGTDGAGGFQSVDRPLRTVTTLDRFAYVRPNGSGYEMRMLQPPELAAAMGFSSCHSWVHSTRRERIKLIGNAVCPPLMQKVVRTLINRH